MKPILMLTPHFLLAVSSACWLVAQANAAQNNLEKTRQLVNVLQSNAAFYDQARACQQLGEFGTREAIPALAAQLADEHLSAYARSGLEGIPDPAAAEALRNAIGSLKGSLLAGVINSLGVLRDAQAVGLLVPLAEDPNSGVVKEALLALGCISTAESIPVIQQALAKESGLFRTNAAAACLLAAEKQMADGHYDAAIALYDLVRQANVPPVYRAGATRGAIIARKTNGVPLLLEQLRSPDLILRNVALITIREIPSDTLASALNNEIHQASTERQILLLIALGDCHNAQSLQLLQAKAASQDAEVRQTALSVLGKIGGASEAGVFLEALTENRSAEESAIALNFLGRLEGTAVNEQIVKTLVSTTDAGARIQLIRLLESRGATNTTSALLKQASDPDAKVSVSALRALKSLAGPGDLPALIDLVKAGKDEAIREAAENAIVGAGTRAGNPAAAGEAILTELKQATEPLLKTSWIRVLVSFGYAKALPAIMAAVHEANESVANNALEQLARWPEPTPIDDLFVVVQTSASSAQRKRALNSIIQLVTAATEAHQRPDATLVQWFQRANQAAQTAEDRRLIISGLAHLKHFEGFRLLRSYLDDPALQSEAAFAIIQIAPALALEDPSAMKNTLDFLSTSAKTEALRSQATKASRSIPRPANPTSLFDGRSLAGWEGNTKVWRVREGVIVGGSLDGNPRNEFLASVRGYTNFVLRLEYKLVGTEGFVNGGVQFRSVRVKQPDNEMSGFQADLGAGYSGCLYDESRRNKFLVRAPEEQIKRLEKPGEWNRYEISCAGPRILIRLNGEKTVDYTEADAAIPQSGLIALQIHGGCKAEISFRNLVVEELVVPSSSP